MIPPSIRQLAFTSVRISITDQYEKQYSTTASRESFVALIAQITLISQIYWMIVLRPNSVHRNHPASVYSDKEVSQTGDGVSSVISGSRTHPGRHQHLSRRTPNEVYWATLACDIAA